MSAIKPYPIPGCLTKSPYYRVLADGIDVFTEHYKRKCPQDAPDWFRAFYDEDRHSVNITRFACGGPFELVIEMLQPFTAVHVRPESLGLTPKVEGGRVSLSLPGPCKLYVEAEGNPALSVFADEPERDVPCGGGKTRFFGPGVHRPGPMKLQDGETIYIDGGAVVYGGIYGSPKNARVMGRGILDGSELTCRHVISFENAADVLVEGIVTRSGIEWQHQPINCDRVTYRNVKVFSFCQYGDGIDPTNCRDMLIEDCYLQTSDDCIAVKAFHGMADCRGITIRRCISVGYSFGDGATVGFELDCDNVCDILVQDCDVLCALGGNLVGGHSAFSVICNGRAWVRNMVFDGIRAEENLVKLFEATVTDGRQYNNFPVGHIDGVTVKNTTWKVARPIVLGGQDEDHLVENVTFENCTVAGRKLTQGDPLFQINEFARCIKVL